MNLSKPLNGAVGFVHSLWAQYRMLLPRQRCHSFIRPTETHRSGIGPIFVINLDRQPSRMNSIIRELSHISDSAGVSLSERVVRHSAFDAQTVSCQSLRDGEVEPLYTLNDQLF